MTEQARSILPLVTDDEDPLETQEWLEAFDAVARVGGPKRGAYLLKRLEERAQGLGLKTNQAAFSAYRNTIPLDAQAAHPGDVTLEERITAIVRWNALAMVVRANKAYGELGGHIASYASAAEIFEIGFNHFFRGATPDHPGDLVFFQPHSSPGVYARAFIEGRLTESQLANYRQEARGGGLCSYPHQTCRISGVPHRSMGIGPINAVSGAVPAISAGSRAG